MIHLESICYLNCQWKILGLQRIVLNSFSEYTLVLRAGLLHAKKKKNVRGNNIPFMNRSFKKAHMKISRLRNRFLKNRSSTNKTVYNKKGDYFVSFARN